VIPPFAFGKSYYDYNINIIRIIISKKEGSHTKTIKKSKRRDHIPKQLKKVKGGITYQNN
jgi:hypothetical protein